jgi:hypothetical protein
MDILRVHCLLSDVTEVWRKDWRYSTASEQAFPDLFQVDFNEFCLSKKIPFKYDTK